jgi:hypothetical protein
VSAVHPYAELRALLDTTRQLTPEEMAELHLEQGFVDRALRIYDELAAREPANPSYATRREWLARMAAARPATPAKARAREEAPRDRTRTLMGIGPVRQADGPAMVRRLRIVGVR